MAHQQWFGSCRLQHNPSYPVPAEPCSIGASCCKHAVKHVRTAGRPVASCSHQPRKQKNRAETFLPGSVVVGKGQVSAEWNRGVLQWERRVSRLSPRGGKTGSAGIISSMHNSPTECNASHAGTTASVQLGLGSPSASWHLLRLSRAGFRSARRLVFNAEFT